MTEDDERSLPNGNHHVSAEPSTGITGGSNPTPGAFGSTPCVETRHIQQIEPDALSQIINFRLWMRKQGYRHSTVRYCIQALKSIARHANVLQPESAKAYLAYAEISESRKAKLTEDQARFYAYKHPTFDKPNYQFICEDMPLKSEVAFGEDVARKITKLIGDRTAERDPPPDKAKR